MAKIKRFSRKIRPKMRKKINYEKVTFLGPLYGLKSVYKSSVYKIGVYLGFGAEANFVNSRFPVQLSSSLLTKGQMRNGGLKKYSESRTVYKKMKYLFHPYFFCIDCRNRCIWRYEISLSPKLAIYSGAIHQFIPILRSP